MQGAPIRHACAVLRRQAVRQVRRRALPVPPYLVGNRAFASAAQVTSAAPVAADQNASVPAASDPISRYESLVRTGVLRDDPYQRGIIERLQRLHAQLRGYVPDDVPSPGASGWVSPVFLSLSVSGPSR